MNESCPVCGCVNYTQHGFNPASNEWGFKCSNPIKRHRWFSGSINYPFPWREDDPKNPANLKRVGGDKS